MDVRNISIYSNGFGREAAGQKSFFQGIGQKGEQVQGTITKVGDYISINFNGIEVNVSRNVLKNAKEGEVRNFEITSVSSDSIVLKEIGSVGGTAPVRGMVSTTVSPSDYSFAECLEAGKDTAEAERQASESLAVLNGEDCQEIEEEEGSLMEKTREGVERAVQKHKERKEWTQKKLEEGAELRKEWRESLEKLQAQGFLANKSEEQIREALEEAGLPVTTEIMEKVVSALGMSQTALELTDRSRTYLIGQNLAPTIENLYQGKFQGADSLGMQGKEAQNLDAYKDQIERILQECGRANAQGRQDAAWLFDRELPINEETLSKLEMLNGLSERMTPDKVLEQILHALTAGLSPKDAVLDDSQFVLAKDVVEGFWQITDGTIIQAADLALQQNQDAFAENEEEEPVVNLELLRGLQAENGSTAVAQEAVPVVYTADMTEKDILQVTLKRQLEEIRLKMTIQSAAAMEKMGIHVETEPLGNIIQALREMENAYYSGQVAGQEDVSPEQLALLQESLEKSSDIANSHAALLGVGVRQQTLLTMNELHAAVGSVVANRKDWQGVFEAVSTQVRTDLGDSIQKAFEGIPALLDDIGVEQTEANERAVRILGYNGMEITEENIEQVKFFDAKVNRVIDNMKPTAVLELIRRGENPLDMPLDKLNQDLEEIRQEKGISSEERYSRFLWQMEKSGQITKEERAGYIGVYRLLNQLQKTDGAAIGALIGTGQELTLGNLLTQVRTRRSKGIDSVVSETAGVREGAGMQNSITDQIHTGFSQHAYVSGKEEQTEYYRHLAGTALEELTPAGLKEMTDGEMERLLNVSLEKFCEELKQTSGKREAELAYFEEQAKQLREKATSGEEAEKYLSKLHVEATIGNILAAEAMLEEGYAPYREGYSRRKVLPEEQQQELEDVIEMVAEAADEEELAGRCEKAEKFMSEILTKSYEQADINLEDLSKLRIFGQGIRLEGAMRHSRSYDIPIRTGDSITTLNLTLIHGSEESGKIQISMEHEVFGNISIDMKVSDGKIKGLVLCDRRQGFEALQGQGERLEADLENAGYQIKNISYGMDFKSRNELLNEPVSNQREETGQLYQVAKLLVRSVTAAIRE